MLDTVVFISPTFPRSGGNGLSMRAASMLKLLSLMASQLHLIVIPIYEPEQSLCAELAEYCKSWQRIAEPRSEHAKPAPAEQRHASFLEEINSQGLQAPSELLKHKSGWQTKIDRAIEGLHPDLLVVFRFYTAQFVLASFAGKLPIFLDLDELESKSRGRLMQIYAASGNLKKHSEMKNDAAAYLYLEQRHMSCFDRIFVSSELEKQHVLAASQSAKVHVLPNSYPKVLPKPLRKADSKLRLLFVGNFNYYPNLDAVNYFCSEILPLIKAGSDLTVELDLVGCGLEEANLPDGVNYVGAASDIERFYSACDAVVVPLRAAGGTRIKILEAFSNARPVISTSIGAEGLAVQNGVHVLLADSAREFAGACIELARDADKRQMLSTNGHELFLESYSPDRLESLAWSLFS